jgi:hypothetical protein
MKLFLRIISGQGITLQGNLDVSELPEGLALKTQNMLKEEILSEASKAERDPFTVDFQEYELVILPEANGEQPQRYIFTEAESNLEVLELLDELMQEIIIKKSDRQES